MITGLTVVVSLGFAGTTEPETQLHPARVATLSSARYAARSNDKLSAPVIGSVPRSELSSELLHNLPVNVNDVTRNELTPHSAPVVAPATSPALRGLYTGAARTLALSHGKSRIVWLEITGYCPCTKCCGPDALGITASGRPVSYNHGAFAAADADEFSFGTRLRIPGYHDAQIIEVIDRGSAIKHAKVDVYFPTHEEAEAWGRQWLPVIVEQE